MAEKQTNIRLTVFVKRKPELSEERFHQWWSKEHGPRLQTWLAKHGVVRYTQYHTPRTMRDQFFGGTTSGATLMDYDGFGEIVIPSPETLKSAMEDPYYHEVVVKDEQEHLDQDGYAQTIGYEESYVRDGEVVSPGDE